MREERRCFGIQIQVPDRDHPLDEREREREIERENNNARGRKREASDHREGHPYIQARGRFDVVEVLIVRGVLVQAKAGFTHAHLRRGRGRGQGHGAWSQGAKDIQEEA